MENRVIVLIDMDCFYCQVEEKLNPDLAGKPIAVVQYNPWKGGGIIAVNYVARARGVTRHMRGDEAKEKCPEIELPSVPCQRGKADISKYRDAGKEVARVLQKFTTLLERASIDEAYLDITSAVQERLKSLPTDCITTEMIPNTFALGYEYIEDFVSDVHTYGNESIEFDHDNAKMLLVGAVIVSEIRAAVYTETGYRCSAGISHNKILAKLVCGMNKPNKQTVLPKHSVNILYRSLSLKKVKHLGGKFGDSVCEILSISKMGELQTFTQKELQAKFDEKNGTWLYNIARGMDLEPVQAKFNPKSIGCCKQFKGKSALLNLESLTKWLRELGDEIEDRLEKDALENNRMPKQMVVSFAMQLLDGRDTSCSRSYNFVADDELCGEMFSSKALELVMDTIEGVKPKEGEEDRKLQMPIKFLGISVGKFEDNSESKKTRKIVDFFSAGTSKEPATDMSTDENFKQRDVRSMAKVHKKKADKEYILQRFFQVSDKVKIKENVEIQSTEVVQQNPIEAIPDEPVISRLDIQESFFDRFMNKGQKDNQEQVRATTPVCKVVECGYNSNDTDYSSSTINNEINKSIALFEEDPQDVARVSNMRNLLNTTLPEENSPSDLSQVVNLLANEKVGEAVRSQEVMENIRKTKTPSPSPTETFECSECDKVIPIIAFDTHADYHLALTLREEEIKIARQEKEKRTLTQPVKKVETKASKKELSNAKSSKTEQRCGNDTKSETVSEYTENMSLANFLVKFDESKPTEKCPECGKKVLVEKFSEHLDFHEAQKLSRELNQKPVLNNFSSNSVKRKRKSASPLKTPKLPCKTIDSFFK